LIKNKRSKEAKNMNMLNIKINGQDVSVPAGTTILEAAKSINVHIPTLCYLKDINEIGACRMCLVEIKGGRSLVAACVYPCSEGMEVFTNTPVVRETRKAILELILSNHNRECTTCDRSGVCELQQVSEDLGVREIRYMPNKEEVHTIDALSPSVVRDPSKCILCGRCISVCRDVQGLGALGATNRGFKKAVEPPFEMTLNDVNCINCGQCIINCPVGALKEKDDTTRVWEALADPTKHVLVHSAPSVRAGLGEAFGLPVGSLVSGKLAASLRRLGFDRVFDTNFAADLCIMEEGTELIGRVTGGGKLPMITSCSPGWIKYCEMYYPDLLDHLSSCKSPQGMMGAILKSHYAQSQGLDPKDVFVVSIMPCTAKKFEVLRPELSQNGLPDNDVSITSRELARMIKEAGIDFLTLPDEEFDEYYGDYTGAATIFGATGGVMEAAARTAVEVITGKEAENIDYEGVRGVEGIKSADIKAGDLTIKVMVAHGGSNIRKVMDDLRAGKLDDVHFIELMACPGGCVNGGGQPIVSAQDKMNVDIRVERAKALYHEDKDVLGLRKSHENPSIKKLYDEFLEKPNSHKAHELLHTTYTARPKINNK
jgi:NADP-reducing hydrogenase subunit HndD